MFETTFTPWASLAGGVLIGLSATLLMLLLGRIMGATGVLAGLLQPSSSREVSWRAAVLAGMVSAPPLIWLVSGEMPAVEVPNSTATFVIGGLIAIGGPQSTIQGVPDFAAVLPWVMGAALLIGAGAGIAKRG